jgi:leucyl aminopeptidase
VLNTDAEGRLILADALSYAQTLNPKLTIDIATLTGAANAAVGEHAAVILGTAGKELKTLIQTGLEQWEPLVEFPLWSMYAEQLKSDMADMKNVGGQYAGTITAAKFLQKFTDYPWIHIDIAGSAYVRNKYSYKGVGATAFGVRLLYEGIKKLEEIVIRKREINC